MSTTDEIMALAYTYKYAEGTNKVLPAHIALGTAINALVEQAAWAHHTPALLTDADAAADLAGVARPGAEPVAWSYTVGKTVHLHNYPTEHYYNDGNKYVKGVPLYTTPQASQLLTGWHIDDLCIEHCGDGGPTAICEQFAHDIGQALRGIGAAQKGKPAPDAVDDLQGAANWLCADIDRCNVADIQQRLSISYNRARRLLDAAIAAQKGKP